MINWIKQLLGLHDDRTPSLRDEYFEKEEKDPPITLDDHPASNVIFITNLVELKSMKKDDLLAYAESRGIRVKSDMKKQEIINAIISA